MNFGFYHFFQVNRSHGKCCVPRGGGYATDGGHLCNQGGLGPVSCWELGMGDTSETRVTMLNTQRYGSGVHGSDRNDR